MTCTVIKCNICIDATIQYVMFFSCYLVKFEKQKNPRWLHFWHLTYFPSTDLDPSTFGQPHTIGVTSSSTDTAKDFNTVQNASLTTSPSSNSSSAFNHSLRSGEVKPSQTEVEGEEEKKGSGEELWRSFIVHHKPGTVLPWTWTETKDAMICKETMPRGQSIHHCSCPWLYWNKRR